MSKTALKLLCYLFLLLAAPAFAQSSAKSLADVEAMIPEVKSRALEFHSAIPADFWYTHGSTKKLWTRALSRGTVRYPTITYDVVFKESDNCSGANAYVEHFDSSSEAVINICDGFYASGYEEQITMLLHEYVHVAVGPGECLPIQFSGFVQAASTGRAYIPEATWEVYECGEQFIAPPLY